MKETNPPNYKRIYTDMLIEKYPDKIDECKVYLNKDVLNYFDVIQINKIIFGVSKTTDRKNQRHKGYSKAEIIYMLEYQKKENLTNSQLAIYFKLSRNTVAKWKKHFTIL